MHVHSSLRLVLALVAALNVACNEGSRAPQPAEPPGSARSAPAGTATATGATPSAAPTAAPAHADTWFRISKEGYDLGVVEVLRGKAWRVVLHSNREDARALDKLVKDHAGKPIGLDMHLPSENSNQRGPYGTASIPPGDKLYPFAVEEHLRRQGFDVSGKPPHFEDSSPPKSVSKLEFSRDGAKVGTLDLSVTPARLELANRDGNAIFLESFWKAIDAEDPLTVSYLVSKDGRDVLTTVSAKKGGLEYANTVRIAFAVRYPNYGVVVVP